MKMIFFKMSLLFSVFSLQSSGIAALFRTSSSSSSRALYSFFLHSPLLASSPSFLQRRMGTFPPLSLSFNVEESKKTTTTAPGEKDNSEKRSNNNKRYRGGRNRGGDRLGGSRDRGVNVGVLASSSFVGFKKTIPSQISPEKAIELEEGKARLFKEGNPLIFGGAVKYVHGVVRDGDIVDVLDHQSNFVGWGIYNSKSMYRVRLLCSQYDEAKIVEARDLELLLDARIKRAFESRRACQLPNEETNIFRLIHGEGDRLSGLVIDVYNDIVVVSSSALWCEMNKEIIMKTLEKQLSLNLSSLKIQDIIWRQSEGRLEQDGYVKEKKNNNLNLEGQEIVEKEEVVQAKAIEEVEEEENDEENEELRKMKFDPNECCVGKENGLEYYISPRKGQKTGFYCDQRENRAFLSSLVKDKNVLDLFCYTGGFSLNAMKGQAQTVVGVDSSQKAINTARANVELNQFDSNKIQFVKEDSEKFMSSANENGLQYDVVILDPPKLAPNTKALPRAVNKYKKLNVAALKLVKPGGLLLSCTCSSAVTMSGDFLKIITASAVEAGRHITVLRQSSTSLDHVTNPNYMETNYLTAILVVVH